METPTRERDPGGTTTDAMVPDVIERFYRWAERSSLWEIEMYEWADKLKTELETRNIALDKVPPPPPRWP